MNYSPYVILALLICGGLFIILCAAKNYDWFFSHRRARTMMAIFGRTGTRIVYIAFGLALVAFGVVFIARGEFTRQSERPEQSEIATIEAEP